MSHHVRRVAVKQLPVILGGKQRGEFRRELQVCLNVDRPWIVLDCSKVEQFDLPLIRLVLFCLEEAMKRNGDVRLAAMPDRARTSLEMMGVSRMFEIYDTIAEASKGFHQFPAGPTL